MSFTSLSFQKIGDIKAKNTWNSSHKLAKENLLSKNNLKAHGASEEGSLTLRYNYKLPQEKE